MAVDGLTAYLRGYPYLCTEQLLSQAMPALVYSSRPELGHTVDRATGDRGNLIDVLRSRQNSEGGLGVWTATPDADPFVTGYAALYLLESRERGITVPEDMLTSLNAYLETLAADASHNDLPFLRQRAMAVYLLVRQGRTASNLLSAVQEQLKRDQPKTWQDDAAGMLVAASYQLLQQDKPARALAVKGLGRVNTAVAKQVDEDYFYYYDDGIEQAWTLYLLNRHFPALARQVKPVALDKLMAPLRENRFNTLSSALTVLALDAQAGALGNPPPATLQAAGKDGAARQIGKVRGVVTVGKFTGADTRLWVTPASAVPVWYVLNQSGYDRTAPATAQNQGLEVLRDYLDEQGKPVTVLKLGQEVTVRLRVRALGAKARGQIAIVDLLPGGFEAVLQTPAVAAAPAADEGSEGGDDEGEEGGGEDYTPNVVPLALPGSTYTPEHIELREDRVVLYGSAWEKVVEFRYKLRANNAGTFVVPPIYAESMYQRSVYAQGGPAGSLKVTTPSP